METLQWLQQHLPQPAFDALKFTNGLILLFVLLVPLERLFAQRPQRVLRPGFATDVGWYFVSSLLPGRLLWLPLLALAWLAPQLTPAAWQTAVGALPGWARLAAGLVVAELGAYWGHRWMHAVPLLWRFHALHHSAEQMDWLVNTRAHPVDLVFTRLCSLLPLYALGLAQPAAGRVDWLPLLVTLLAACWGYFVHANLRWRFGALEHVVATPAFHHRHHANEGASRGHANYAPTMPWVDRLFGTYRVGGWPAAYGIDQPMAPTLAGQLLQPFRADLNSPAAAGSRPSAPPGGPQTRSA